MRRATLFLGGWMLVMASGVSAQILTGTIIGTVRDDSGAVLPGVTVSLKSPSLPEGGITVVTNDQGQYRFAELVPGPYSLTLTMEGFGTYQEQDLIVAVGGTTERTVKLQLGSIAETITVSGESPMIDPRKVGVTSNLDTKSLETLPRNRNAIYELMKWTPGVAPPDPSGGSGGSVMGAATGENSNLLDGVMTNHPSSGGGWSSGDVDAMEEVQVLTLGASAEYQVAQGGVFNVVMKQGTNTWKGDGSAYWYPDSLLSKPVKRPCNCDLDQTGHINLVFRNYSGHIGGPIRKDRLWVFAGGNYDRRKQGLPGTDPRLIPKLWYSDALFGKVTWRMTDNMRFTGMYHQDIYGSQTRPTASRPFETINASDAPWLISYAPEINYTLSSQTLLTARATGWTDRVKSFPYTGDKTASYHLDAATGVACCGVPSFGNTSLGRHGQAVKLNHHTQGGWASHDMRIGLQFEEAHAYGFNAYPSGVQYSDLNGQPDQASFRTPYAQGAEYTSQGIWAEDQMTFGGRLTISLGVRFDRMHAKSPDLPHIDNQLEETGETINGLGDMFTWKVAAPRVGFNYKLTDDGKTIVRGHYGRAYRTIFLGDFEIVHPGLSPITLTRFDPATGRYSTIISVTDSLANTAVDPDIKTPFTDSFSLGADRELFANLAVSLTYAYKYGQDVVGWLDTGGVYGTRTDVLPDGQTVTVLPLLNAPRERRFTRTNGPGGFTRYHGLIVEMKKRLSRRWTGNVSYTYSKATGLMTTGTLGQDPNDNINASGLLATDRPHMVLAGGTYQIPKIDADVSVTYLGVSGTPFAPQALIQLPQGRRAVNIAAPDGTYRVPAQKLLTVRFTKILFRKSNRQLELGVAGDNLLQSIGYNSLVTQNFYSPSFAAGDSFIEGRRMNFVARVKF